MKTAVLGAGIIGIDLVTKLQGSPLLECCLVVARAEQARGLRIASTLGCKTSAEGVDALLNQPEPFDIVFDATNALSHAKHWSLLEPLGTTLIDLTPSMTGFLTIPIINGPEAVTHRNISLVSCAGQVAIPILYQLSREITADYVEIVTSAASSSIGRATRLNLDEYTQTTQAAVLHFTGMKNVKVMANVSPAKPPPPFRAVLSVVTPEPDADQALRLVTDAADEVRKVVPGYQVKVFKVTKDMIVVAVEVTASGDRVPEYAGNVDILNSAAVHMAEQYATSQEGQR